MTGRNTFPRRDKDANVPARITLNRGALSMIRRNRLAISYADRGPVPGPGLWEPEDW